MSTKHTPGRWRVSADGDEVTTSPIGILESSKTICKTSSHYRSEEECHANARLIAAAPELLESLEQMLCLATRNDIPESEQLEIASRAIDVLQKARGAA